MPKKQRKAWIIEVGMDDKAVGIFSSKFEAIQAIDRMFDKGLWDTSDIGKIKPLDGLHAFTFIEHKPTGKKIMLSIFNNLMNNGTGLLLRTEALLEEKLND